VRSAYTRKSFVGVISCVLGVAATFFSVQLAFVLLRSDAVVFFTPPHVAPEQR
jgi:multisubunit Na+/H+ antiporter MnhG subunit